MLIRALEAVPLSAENSGQAPRRKCPATLLRTFAIEGTRIPCPGEPRDLSEKGIKRRHL